MRTVYLVPGLYGTGLTLAPDGSGTTWADYTALALGLIGRLRLAADGVSPGPPDGRPLYPSDPLADYYLSTLLGLTVQLAAHDYAVRYHGWDWRIRQEVAGVLLADRIRSATTLTDPCTLVGHSAGGIVCRLAWADLARTGQTALVRRIVTLGTPHWGSYSIVRLWSLDEPTMWQLTVLTAPAALFYSVNDPLYQVRTWTPDRLAALSATWPTHYGTLPSLLAPDASDDPGRAALYTAPWPGFGAVSQPWLNYARDVLHPLLASDVSLPPWRVLTTVAGVGVPTVGRLADPRQLGYPAAYWAGLPGDGRVTRDSALIAQSVQLVLPCLHDDLPRQTTALGTLAELILAEYPPEPEPPDPEELTDPPPPPLQGPPAPRLGITGGGGYMAGPGHACTLPRP